MKFRIRHVVHDELPQTCKTLLGQGMRFLTMVASDERERPMNAFVIRYIFGRRGDACLTIVESVVPATTETFPSVTPVLPAISWYEREAYDMFGIRPIGHPDLRRLVLHEHWPQGAYPLRKDYPLEKTQPKCVDALWAYPSVEGKGVYEVPVGPVHAGVIEPGHFRFHVMGDSVLHLETKLFFTHRGIEKRAEGLNVKDGLQLAEQICGVCSVSNTLSYAQAIENIAAVEIPKRAQFIRTLFAELERIYNHVSDIGNICGGIGFSYGINHGARLKEKLMQLNDSVIGHRYLRGMISLGGTAQDMTDIQLKKILQITGEVESEISEIVDIVLSHDIVQTRFQKIGVLEHETAQNFATVGPAARASGIDIDSRRDYPYAAYPMLLFRTPILYEGDVFSRYKLRVLEAEQTFSLIKQIISQMPDGPISIPIGNLPSNVYGVGISESPRGNNVHFVMTGQHNTIFRYRVRSAAYANWPVVPLCAPGNSIADFPLINKSFELCYSCCDR